MTFPSSLSPELQALIDQVQTLAGDRRGDYLRLLELLRVLETLHRQIRVDYFEPALPNTRRGLYGLLRDIEESGGWPYIERGKLQVMMQYLISDLQAESNGESHGEPTDSTKDSASPQKDPF